MKISVPALLLLIATQIQAKCNVCNKTSLFACFSIDQFIPCDVNGVFDLAALGTCSSGMVCNQNLGGGSSCGVLSSGVSCKIANIPLKIPATTLTPITTTLPPTTTTLAPTIPTLPPTTTTLSPTTTTLPPTMTTMPATTTTMEPTTTTTSPTTSTTTITTKQTTPLALFNVNAFCLAKATGRYAHPSYTTCASYVYCFSNGTAMIGAPYTCTASTWFNPITQYCDPAFICV
ncbi:hypothetical protein ACKWTF_003986 [Chironomus riparius]